MGEELNLGSSEESSSADPILSKFLRTGSIVIPPDDSASNKENETVEALRTIQKVSIDAETLKKEVENFKEKQKSLDEEYKKLREEVSSWEQKLDENKLKIVELLGIFVALFTFVSLDFGLFKDPPKWHDAFSLVLTTAGILIGFILTLELIINTSKGLPMKRYILLYALSGCLIVGGLIGFAAPYIKSILPSSSIYTSSSPQEQRAKTQTMGPGSLSSKSNTSTK
ncbi:MAG: hypothetical protein WC750_05490 [Patescibacteria group bacterium]|jgi:hypothetical protein